jgi:hypothetical protein
LQENTAQEKADAFHRVLGTGEERNPLEELSATGLAVRVCFSELDRRLGGGLREVFGDATDALRQQHPYDGEGRRPTR